VRRVAHTASFLTCLCLLQAAGQTMGRLLKNAYLVDFIGSNGARSGI
jgi:hypothetical protein